MSVHRKVLRSEQELADVVFNEMPKLLLIGDVIKVMLNSLAYVVWIPEHGRISFVGNNRLKRQLELRNIDYDRTEGWWDPATLLYIEISRLLVLLYESLVVAIED